MLWAVVFSFRIIELILCRQYKAATLVATLCAVSALYWLDTNLGFAKIALAGLHREPWHMNIYSVQLGQSVIPNIELTKQNITNLFGKQATMNGNMFVSLALWFSTVLAVRNRQVVWGLFTLGLFLMLWGAGPRLELIRGFGMTNPVHFFLHDVIQIAKAFRYLPFFFFVGQALDISECCSSPEVYQAVPIGNCCFGSVQFRRDLVNNFYRQYFPQFLQYTQKPRTFLSQIPEKTVYAVPSEPTDIMVTMAHLDDATAKISNGWSGYWPQFAQIQLLVEKHQRPHLCEFLASHNVDRILNIYSGDFQRCSRDYNNPTALKAQETPTQLNFSMNSDFWRFLPYLDDASAEKLNGLSYVGSEFAFVEGYVFKVSNPLNCANEIKFDIVKDDLGVGKLIVQTDAGEAVMSQTGTFIAQKNVFPNVITLQRLSDRGDPLPLRIGVSSIKFSCI